MLKTFKPACPAGQKWKKPDRPPGTPRARLADMMRRNEPTLSGPWCSECASSDVAQGGELRCWNWIDAVTGKPLDPAYLRGLSGPCGPLAVGYEPSHSATTLPARPNMACVSCRHHVLDASSAGDGYHGHRCDRFVTDDGRRGNCPSLRSANGACDLNGEGGFEPSVDAATKRKRHGARKSMVQIDNAADVLAAFPGVGSFPSLSATDLAAVAERFIAVFGPGEYDDSSIARLVGMLLADVLIPVPGEVL